MAAVVALAAGCTFDPSGWNTSDGAVALSDAAGSTSDSAASADAEGVPDGQRTIDAAMLPDATTYDAATIYDAAPPDAADGDHDGVADEDDNCVGDYNPAQHDEDGDGVGDACDNCPSVSNEDQANDGESEVGVDPDEVGDVCDPRPDAPGDTLVFFDGFNDELVASHWSTVGDVGCAWSISGGALMQSEQLSCVLYINDLVEDRAVVDTRFTVGALPVAADVARYIGFYGQYDPFAGTGYACLHYYDGSDPTSYWYLIEFLPGPDSGLANEVVSALVEGGTYAMRMAVSGDPAYQMCAIREPLAAETVVLWGDSATSSSGTIALRTVNAPISVPFVIVYGLGAFID